MPPKGPYFNQQQGTPPGPARPSDTRSRSRRSQTPNGPKPTGQPYLDQQAQQLHDKGGQ